MGTRRTFLQQSAAVSALPFVSSISQPFARLANRNSRLQYALIGAGGNGTRTAPVAQKFVDMVAICDVDTRHLERGNEMLTGGKADTYRDYRKVLARDDIDVVQISTPDHWHTKILIEAMLAGKDAYCEKPLTLTIDEGKLIRKVQKETGRVVQVGTQQRSSFDLFNKALAIIADGRLGKLHTVTTNIGSGGWSPEIPLADVPKELDWDRWLGPSPEMPFRYAVDPKKPDRKYTNGHTQFRWWYEHSGGKLTDWGAHHIDIAMLGIAAAGQNNDPVSVEGTSKHAVEFKDGIPLQDDRYNTAQKFDLSVAFADGDVNLKIQNGGDNGILFEGDQGRIFVNRGKLVGAPVEGLKDKPLPEDAIAKIYRGMTINGNNRDAHWANLVESIEKRTLPISDVHSHMKMLNVCHLAGICCRLGRKIHWDQASETITGDELAASMMKRPYREGYEIDMGTLVGNK
ncbi:Gfo/Idh/MocA family protein [Mariniblastus fucicola]|uniref:4-carboxy-2-hydroxymuconate-6-semialdehyde dehydrogenase n=1 Tax=Mariniblastus fucicola TaxID=980251 RepID=A0A5B9PFS7_9BACT|nr:Gfo/Idh/MocA family oxidoreductase [Mariniblastus fucicola]QEG21811.1 4-carboxy-2-hydroxymuconate-6-semialdehyde dehydrogenase [Mariniblastus fucicola]